MFCGARLAIVRLAIFSLILGVTAPYSSHAANLNANSCIASGYVPQTQEFADCMAMLDSSFPTAQQGNVAAPLSTAQRNTAAPGMMGVMSDRGVLAGLAMANGTNPAEAYRQASETQMNLSMAHGLSTGAISPNDLAVQEWQQRQQAERQQQTLDQINQRLQNIQYYQSGSGALCCN